jgi:hypothetical protein
MGKRKVTGEQIAEKWKELAWKAEEKEMRRLERIIRFRTRELIKKIVG